jgi:hypothetical protein
MIRFLHPHRKFPQMTYEEISDVCDEKCPSYDIEKDKNSNVIIRVYRTTQEKVIHYQPQKQLCWQD